MKDSEILDLYIKENYPELNDVSEFRESIKNTISFKYYLFRYRLNELFESIIKRKPAN